MQRLGAKLNGPVVCMTQQGPEAELWWGQAEKHIKTCAVRITLMDAFLPFSSSYHNACNGYSQVAT